MSSVAGICNNSTQDVVMWLRHFQKLRKTQPITVAVRSKASVYGRSLAGIEGSNPAGGMDVCLL